MIHIGTKQAGVWSMKRYWERVHGLNGLMVMLVVTMLVIGWVVLLDLTVDHSFLQGVLSCVKDREAKNKDASDMVCWILHWRVRRSTGCQHLVLTLSLSIGMGVIVVAICCVKLVNKVRGPRVARNSLKLVKV